ncbi:hypothetical protein QQF64_017711 [Cirrhinus molitorella]|uniref:Uncharacterized protein n=1 Tax=Cirrhinus molitorella TaxID=172907 RepID=A0ABR3LJG1_9TELE
MLNQIPARMKSQDRGVEGGRRHRVDLTDNTLVINDRDRATGEGDPSVADKQTQCQGDTVLEEGQGLWRVWSWRMG